MMNKHYAKDFPLLQNRIENERALIYLDNAATTQKPVSVIDAVRNCYENTLANPHRGAYSLSSDATILLESTRVKTSEFINAASPDEIIFTPGTTYALNNLAQILSHEILSPDDEILISIAEHHSNLLPWQAAAKNTKAKLRYLYLDEHGHLSLEEITRKINSRTKIVAINHISNVLGIETPMKDLVQTAHKFGAVVVLDGAQSVPHIPVDVQNLGIDFMAFSAHKMLGPSGIGVLYGKKEMLDRFNPVIQGGGIVEEVTRHDVRFLPPPLKFEPGTPNIEGIIGFSAALDYINQIGMKEIETIEQELTDYALTQMLTVPHIEIYGDCQPGIRKGILSFNIRDIHPHDTASILNADGIAIRAGHHCAQPLLNYLNIKSCCRMSLCFYNCKEEIDQFIDSLKKVRRWLGYES